MIILLTGDDVNVKMGTVPSKSLFKKMCDMSNKIATTLFTIIDTVFKGTLLQI